VAAATDKSKKSADAKDAPEGGKSNKSNSKLLFIVIALVLVLGGGGGAWFFLNKPTHEKAAATTTDLPKPAQYFAMEPAFVVNLAGTTQDDGPRYLQLEVQLMTRDPEDLKLITENAPAIRAHLLMLFSQVQVQDIADIAGRKKLQAAALADAQKLMTAETGKKCVEDLLFTSFVTQ
jgi:flagellar protein FliL